MLVLKDTVIVLGMLLTAYLVHQFQARWVGNEYTATTMLKLNEGLTTFLFSLAFLGSVALTLGTYFSATGREMALRLSFDAALVLWFVFFLLLNALAGGVKPWERG
ncbi:MAG: hypothetical protein ABEJ75_00860 [Candidatus Nanohaloarchaea archaeon]